MPGREIVGSKDLQRPLSSVTVVREDQSATLQWCNMFLFVTVVRIDKWNQLHDIYEMSLNSRPGSTVPDFCPVVCRFIFSLKTFYRKQSFFFFCHFPLLKPYKIQGVIITCKFHCGCVFYMNTFNYHRQNTFMQQMNTIQVQISDDRRLSLWIPLQQGCGPIDDDFQCCQLYQSERRVDDVLYVSYKCVFLNW